MIMKRVFFILSALGLGYLCYPTLKEIGLIAWEDEDYSHGLILPLVSLYVLWIERGKIYAAWAKARPERPSILAFLLFVLGLFGVVAGEWTQILYLSWVGIFPLVIGFLVLSFGWRAISPFIAPILLLFMAKPIPDSLVPILFFPLQVFAAKVSAQVLELLNVPVYLVGNIIEIPSMRLMVEEACSGIRSLMALLTVACIVMLVVPLGNLARVFIFLVSILTAIALNVFRVAITGILAHFYDPKAASGFFHEFSGLVVFGIGLAVVYSLAIFMSKKGESTQPLVPFHFPKPSWAVFVVAPFVLYFVYANRFVSLQSESSVKEQQLAVTSFPKEFDGWIGTEGEKMELTSREILKLDQYIRRYYSKAGERRGFVYIGYWGKQSGEYQAAKHSPMMCLPANGFKISKLAPTFIDLEGGRRLEVSRVLSHYDQHNSLVYYFFFNGPQYYVREWEALIRIAGNGILGRKTDGGIVEVVLELSSEEARELGQTGTLANGETLLKAAVKELDKMIVAHQSRV